MTLDLPSSFNPSPRGKMRVPDCQLLQKVPRTQARGPESNPQFLCPTVGHGSAAAAQGPGSTEWLRGPQGLRADTFWSLLSASWPYCPVLWQSKCCGCDAASSGYLKSFLFELYFQMQHRAVHAVICLKEFVYGDTFPYTSIT